MASRQEFVDRVRREVRRTSGLFPATPAPRPARPAEEAAAERPAGGICTLPVDY